MTKVQYQKALAKLEREADEKGCCVLPSRPLFDPDDVQSPAQGTRKPRKRNTRSP